MKRTIPLRQISIIGPPGSGKTTLLKGLRLNKISKSYDNAQEIPLLDNYHMFRDDLTAFTFQVAVLGERCQRINQYFQEASEDFLICDYDVGLMGKVFSNLFNSDYLKSLYLNIESSLVKFYGVNQSDVVFFLDASEEVLIDRIKNRGNKSDDKISAKTVKEIKESYSNIFRLCNSDKYFIDTGELSLSSSLSEIHDYLSL